MGALGILAAIAVLVGSLQTTAVISEDHRLAGATGKQPVVDVQAIESDTSGRDGFGAR